MTDFQGEGFPDYPNLHLDKELTHRVVELPDEQLIYKLNQYGEFIGREGIMPKHREAANWILDRLLFDQAVRDGIYDDAINQRLEDESCEGGEAA